MEANNTNAEDDLWLLHVIGTLDRATSEDPEKLALNRRVSAAMCVSFADEWIRTYKGTETIARTTTEAARAYLAQPDKTNWAALFRAATASYGFGPGDGCHSIAELGSGCGAGTGCRTGIGWIWTLRHAFGAGVARERMALVLCGETGAMLRT